MTEGIQSLLQKTFGKAPREPDKPVSIPEAARRRPKRQVITNIYSAASAQRFYDPSFKAIAPPPEPQVQPPPDKLVNTGTVQQIGINGAWGKPQQ